MAGWVAGAAGVLGDAGLFVAVGVIAAGAQAAKAIERAIKPLTAPHKKCFLIRLLLILKSLEFFYIFGKVNSWS